jgi:Mrp family chromosome partitioning ATPase
MSQVLAALKGSFDTIIIDSPPLLPVIDGRFLADHVDQILFVTTWRRTPKQLAKRALHSLAFNEHKLLGAVVNHVDPDVLDEIEGVSAGPVNTKAPPQRRVA